MLILKNINLVCPNLCYQASAMNWDVGEILNLFFKFIFNVPKKLNTPVKLLHGLILNSSWSYAACLELLILLFWRSHFIELVQANIK